MQHDRNDSDCNNILEIGDFLLRLLSFDVLTDNTEWTGQSSFNYRNIRIIIHNIPAMLPRHEDK